MLNLWFTLRRVNKLHIHIKYAFLFWFGKLNFYTPSRNMINMTLESCLVGAAFAYTQYSMYITHTHIRSLSEK